MGRKGEGDSGEFTAAILSDGETTYYVIITLKNNQQQYRPAGSLFAVGKIIDETLAGELAYVSQPTRSIINKSNLMNTDEIIPEIVSKSFT